MPADFEIRGAEDFLKLSKALKAAGQTGLRKELTKGIRDAVKAHMPDARKRLADELPSGLKNRANVRQVVKVKTGRDPGVTIAVPYGKRNRGGLGASNARMLNNQGMIRHPVLADTDMPREAWHWVNQPLFGEGWFDDTWLLAAPGIRVALEAVMADVINKIVNGVSSGSGTSNSSPSPVMRQYTTKAGVTRMASEAQIANWTRSRG